MKRWTVTGVVTGSKYLGTFEAETAEQAIEMALAGGTSSCSLCHHCSSECEDPEIERAVASEDEDPAPQNVAAPNNAEGETS